MRPNISQKKLDANRRNAQRATGPRTPAGKRKVRWNAMQHGLLSSDVVLPAAELPENPKEFAGLLERLGCDLQPRGALQEMLVEKIAVCYWRLRRALRSEIGEIRRNLVAAGERDLGRNQTPAAVGSSQ